MTPEEMEKAIIKNLSTRTGNSLEEWIKILLKENIKDKNTMKKCLKEKYHLGHFQAQIVVKNFDNNAENEFL